MKVNKNRIQLSPNHPSLLLRLAPEEKPIFASPIIVDQHGVLVDGYRRFLLNSSNEIEAIEMSVDPLFEAAFRLNYRTRSWDEIDLFLWSRWGRSLGASLEILPKVRFWEGLFQAPDSLISLIARRELGLRQIKTILEAPKRYQPYFEGFLSESIELNANETCNFIEMSCDLAEILKERDLSVLFRKQDRFVKILENPDLDKKRKGDLLLKEMRLLRYPYYHRQLHEFSEEWQKLRLGQGIRVNRNMFVERGILEISFSSASREEFESALTELYDNLSSTVWDNIWKE